MDEAAEATRRQEELVSRLKARGIPLAPAIESAFRALPRGLFLPDADPEKVYSDAPVPLKEDGGVLLSSSSQSSMMALMLSQLALEPGQRVLEIGTGSGYNAALIASLVGDPAAVTTVDIDDDLVRASQQRLAAVGMAGIVVAAADGAFGYAARAPYDRIIVTAGATDIPAAWREQLAEAGRLVVPIALRGVTLSAAFERRTDCLASVSAFPCEFLAMRGTMAGHASQGQASVSMIAVQCEDPARVGPDLIAAAAGSPSSSRNVSVAMSQVDLMKLGIWLAIVEPERCGIRAEGSTSLAHLLPLPAAMDARASFGVCDGASLAVLVKESASLSAPMASVTTPLDLGVRAFGPGAASLSERLVARIQEWDAAGRPPQGRIELRAYTRSAGYTPEPGEHAVLKPETQIVIRLG